MKKIALICFFLIFSGVPLNTVKASSLIDSISQKFENYQVQIFNNHETGEGYFEIFKNGESVYRESQKEGSFFKIGLVYNDKELKEIGLDVNKINNEELAMGKDITGEGIPNLVVSEWTQGAHCCFYFHVFEIGPVFKKIATLDGGDGDVSHFEDINNDKKLEFVTNDWTFEYWKTSFNYSPAPKIILHYAKGKYIIAEDLMFKPEPTQMEFRKKIDSVKSEKSWSEGYPPPALWNHMLNLIYTGHENLAWEFLKSAWPLNVPGRDEFLKEFREQLAQSPYWPQIEEMNKEYSK